MIKIVKTIIKLFFCEFGGGGSTPEAPPPPSAPPTETSEDVAQEADAQKKRLFRGYGREDTVLTRRTNPAMGGQKKKLGE